MPKPAKNLWSKFLEWENFMQAAYKASKGKRYHWEVLRFKTNLEENLLRIREQLISHTWYPGSFRTFMIYEPKERMIHAPIFGDRIVHHALVQVMGEYFERRFIDHSFACRVGKGTHAASECLSHMLRSASARWGNPVYVLKADISKYFPSINHDILLKIISRIIGDKEILLVIERIVKHASCIDGSVGLPLGALTSQLFANTYLDQLDHYIKDEIGMQYYVRYMDDFIILHNNKQELWNILTGISDFLISELHLTLNAKTRIFPHSHGIDFAGYRHWPNYKLPRKRNLRQARRRFMHYSMMYEEGRLDIESVRSSVASFVGYIKHCKGWRSAGSTLDKLVLRPAHIDKK